MNFAMDFDISSRDDVTEGTDDFTLVESHNLSSTNVTSLQGEFEFNHRLLLNVIAYSVMFVVGTIGNTLVSFFFDLYNSRLRVNTPLITGLQTWGNNSRANHYFEFAFYLRLITGVKAEDISHLMLFF